MQINKLTCYNHLLWYFVILATICLQKSEGAFIWGASLREYMVFESRAANNTHGYESKTKCIKIYAKICAIVQHAMQFFKHVSIMLRSRVDTGDTHDNNCNTDRSHAKIHPVWVLHQGKLMESLVYIYACLVLTLGCQYNDAIYIPVSSSSLSSLSWPSSSSSSSSVNDKVAPLDLCFPFLDFLSFLDLYDTISKCCEFLTHFTINARIVQHMCIIQCSQKSS